MAPKLTQFERERLEQVERNKQRFKELGILELKHELSRSIRKPKIPQPQKLKPKVHLSPERKSVRNSAKPRPSYTYPLQKHHTLPEGKPAPDSDPSYNPIDDYNLLPRRKSARFSTKPRPSYTYFYKK